MRVTRGWQAAVSSQQYSIYLPESCWTRPLFPTREKDTWTWQMGQKSIGLFVFYQTLWETHDHYSDVIKSVMASQTTSAPIVCSVVQVQIKENIKLYVTVLCVGKFIGHRWIPRTQGQYRWKCLHLMTSSWMMNKMHSVLSPERCAHSYTYCWGWQIIVICTQIAKFMGPAWGPSGSCRPQMGPMLAPWTLLSG